MSAWTRFQRGHSMLYKDGLRINFGDAQTVIHFPPLSIGVLMLNGRTRDCQPSERVATFFACVFRERNWKPLVPSSWCLCQEK